MKGMALLASQEDCWRKIFTLLINCVCNPGIAACVKIGSEMGCFPQLKHHAPQESVINPIGVIIVIRVFFDS